MREYIFGANILENLTTGMYQDSKVIYREYIQNACDQIDKAYNIGLLKPNEGRIDIWLDAEKRTVSIERISRYRKTLRTCILQGTDFYFNRCGRRCGFHYAM